MLAPVGASRGPMLAVLLILMAGGAVSNQILRDSMVFIS